MAELGGLRKIKPLTLPGLKPAEVDGDLPRLKWVAPTELLVDDTYQRDLSDRSIRLIRKLIENFAWNRLKPVIVVEVKPDIYHVIDGQHTAIAAATLGVPKVPIFIVQAERVDERARAFVGHNSDRIIVSPFDIYRALLAAGDPDAVDVGNVCRRAGVRIRWISPSTALAAGDTAAVGKVRALVKRNGVMKARQILEVLVKAKRTPISAAEIQAVEALYTADPKLDREQLARVIFIEGTAGLQKAQAKAKTDRSPVWRVLSERWQRRFEREAAIA